MTEEIKGRKYTVKEMEDWLLGDSTQAVGWRTNPEHLREVSEMITFYASTPGGRDASFVWSKIKAEKAQMRSVADLEEKQEQRTKRLREVARIDYLKSGGTEANFNREWSSLEKSLLASGRAGDLLDEDTQERRQKTARTF